MKKLMIPSGCTENWEKMLPTGNGKHCERCTKTVTDFTGFSMEELRAYFQQNNQGNTCGRFTPSQLNMDIEEDKKIQKQIPSLHIAAILSAAAVVFTLNTGRSDVLRRPHHSVVSSLKEHFIVPADTTLPASITLEVLDGSGAAVPQAIVKHRETGYTMVANDSGLVIFPAEKINTKLGYSIFEVSAVGFGTNYIRLEQENLMHYNKVVLQPIFTALMGEVMVVQQKPEKKKWWKQLFGRK